MISKKRKISHSFIIWLGILVGIAFLATSLFLWLFQTDLARENAHQLLLLNIKDVRNDIRDASDEYLLSIAYDVKNDIEQSDFYDYTQPEFSQFLIVCSEYYDLAEINYVDRHGVIKATTHPDFLEYDMRSGNQSSEFMVLLDDETQYVQSLRPTSSDDSLSRKYGGVRLKDGGFIQVGYDSERSYRSISKAVVGATRNRHVGKDGCIIIANSSLNIVSDRNGNEGKNLDTTGIYIDRDLIRPNTPFEADVYGESCYCMYHETEGYIIIAVIPRKEAALSRNMAVTVTTVMQVIVFGSLFILVYFLVSKLVVKNIQRVNSSLSEITEGKLDTVVNVRSHAEFDELSDDINSTVDTLKKYIAEADARIDAELAFARAIQHSALPSVFPPYPGRKEFEIYATMNTAKEVGGDFYDFYFIDDDHLAFLVADVSDKGIPAAMFMMQSKTILKNLAESGMSVEKVFSEANKKLCENNDTGMFVTAWMGILNIKTGELQFANAGHNPPLLKRSDGTFEYLRTPPGLVLAGMEDIGYRKNSLRLMSGDTIYLYTDGVTEATDHNQQLYGEDRLRDILNKNRDSDAETICNEVKRDLDLFVAEAPRYDDITMLALRYFGPEVIG